MVGNNLLQTYPNGMSMKQTEEYLEISRQSIRNKSNSGKLQRKRVGGNKFIYDTKDVVKLKNYIDSELLTSTEVKETLADNGLSDKFEYYEDLGNGKKKCKYVRVFDEFPLSPKQLHERGFIDVDDDIKPVRYKKSSLPIAIKKLTHKKSSIANNADYSQTKSA